MHSSKVPISIARLKRAIFQSLRVEVPTLPTTAARIGVSRRSLQRKLETTGMAYSDLVDEVRYELAQSLLMATTLGIADIGAGLRYRDPSSFSRAFLRWSGMSPTDFRARYLKLSAPPIRHLKAL